MNTDSCFSPRILLVDDDAAFRRVLAAELERRRHRVGTAETGQAALDRLDREEIDLILLDLHLPDMDGVEVLHRLRDRESDAGVVVLTGHGSIDTAIQAVRLGAFDYLEKPCPIEQVEMALEKAQEHRRLQRRQRVLQDGYSPPDLATSFVGQSPVFRSMCESVERIAVSEATTLIQGETGSGKELVAKLLHRLSPRRDAPFVVVDCAVLQEDLLQSQLFGHEKGAFTGAARQKHGLYEVADGGTLFLDEIGDTSLEIQAKLLRALETGRFRRLGGNQEISVDVRLVSATNRDLQEAVAQGQFREDLYFRLSPLTVQVPPLRERKEDIPLLVEHYTERFNARHGQRLQMGPHALQALTRYRWPGNVRELIHVVEQTLILADGPVIEPDDLPPRFRPAVEATAGGESPGGSASLRRVKRAHMLAVLEAVSGNRAMAAGILQISERNLYRLLKKYRLSGGAPAPGSSGAEPDSSD